MPLGPLVEVKLEGIFVKLDGRPPGLLPEAQFAAFVRRHWREYSGPEEYAWRLRVFAANLTRTAAHQVLDPTARHSITPSPTSSGKSSRRGSRASLPTATTRRPMPATEEVAVLPASFDLARQGRRDRRQDAGHMRLLLGL
ncbi:hypothetical protein OsJ_01061 [Oryza sativa Japonica Group]|uniref:Cathepsin propeptide inhibitor domain-containing protein n=1 Tax=Oryza sativa subsp. japonica TaxID=39947 RepID=A2ZR60_ORYSJ|nr:hypothetical protein OsJ_01061 [Oryza sativa Japonica Group]